MKLDILGVEYPLELNDHISQSSGHPAYALCENQPPLIQISTAAAPSQRLYLLLHEVYHALSYMGHLQFLRDAAGTHLMDDESHVDALASLTAEFLTRNQQIVVPLIVEGEWVDTSRSAIERLIYGDRK